MNTIIKIFLFGLIVLAPAGCNGQDEERKIPMKYIGEVNAPDFPKGLDWINTDKPISIKELKGKVVLLDFWTYCCINCIHVIPDLKKLEAEYPEELVVIGVHSAKFENEKQTQNIKEAVMRYEIEHPVINDHNFEVWQSYAVRAWPSFALIDPRGKVLGITSGENIYEKVSGLIGDVIEEYDRIGEIDRTPLDLQLEKDYKAGSLLNYPGKIITNSAGYMLYFSDSNNNRIIIANSDGTIKDVIGTGRIGKSDGDFNTAEFFRPQGMALDADNNILYVADTENHLLRAIDLNKRTVSTIAGTGKQAEYMSSGGKAATSALNSPWDLYLKDDILYIAMAGPHQIWKMNIEKQTVEPYAGSGREDIIDGNLKQSAFAQPSGIDGHGDSIYIADSETSSVRMINIKTGVVKTLAGTGLFDFGDIDGFYPHSRLQHPIGLTYHDGDVYIADSYNHKIKRLDPESKTVTTYIGSGRGGLKDGKSEVAELNEPNGLAFAGDLLYITDTNNDAIRIYNTKSEEITTLSLKNISLLQQSRVNVERKDEIKLDNGEFEISINIILPEKAKFNTEAPFSLNIQADENIDISQNSFDKPQERILLRGKFDGNSGEISIKANVYYCFDNDMRCYFKEFNIIQPVSFINNDSHKFNIDFRIKNN